MNNDMKEELMKLNIKMDHITRIVSELFVMYKSNERFDDKLDQCIKSLNNLNYRISSIKSTNSSVPILVPPVVPVVPITSKSSYVLPSHDLLMEELKKKLANKKIE